MADDFLRIVTRGMVDSYPRHGTNDEKLGSRLVWNLRRSLDVSVFKVGYGITDIRIVAALAATRDRPGRIDYVVFGMGGYVAVFCEGSTPDEGVNAVHYGIYDLNDNEIVGFADMIADEDVMRLTEDEVIDAIKESVLNGYISESDINFNLK